MMATCFMRGCEDENPTLTFLSLFLGIVSVKNLLFKQNLRNCDLMSSWSSRKTVPDSDPRWLRLPSDRDAVSNNDSSPVWSASCCTFINMCPNKKKSERKIENIFLPIIFNMCFVCSKERSHWDGSSEYPLHMFWLKNKKISF